MTWRDALIIELKSALDRAERNMPIIGMTSGRLAGLIEEYTREREGQAGRPVEVTKAEEPLTRCTKTEWSGGKGLPAGGGSTPRSWRRCTRLKHDGDNHTFGVWQRPEPDSRD